MDYKEAFSLIGTDPKWTPAVAKTARKMQQDIDDLQQSGSRSDLKRLPAMQAALKKYRRENDKFFAAWEDAPKPKGESSWVSLRDSVQAVAVVTANVFAPGSSLLTSKVASKGAQTLLKDGPMKTAAVMFSGVGIANMLAAPAAAPAAPAAPAATVAPKPLATSFATKAVAPKAVSAVAVQVAAPGAAVVGGTAASGGAMYELYKKAGGTMTADEFLKAAGNTVADGAQKALQSAVDRAVAPKVAAPAPELPSVAGFVRSPDAMPVMMLGVMSVMVIGGLMLARKWL